MKKDNSNFFSNVYDVVKLIPPGRVTSYGAIAQYLGAKGSARMVGWAMSAAHNLKEVPAHRVVNRIGMLTGKHHFNHPEMMQEKLEREGIAVSNDQVKDFNKVFWDPAVALEI